MKIYSVKVHHTCPICEKKKSFIQLKHGKKTIYTRHQRFPKPYHPYRWLKKAFNESQENESAPKPLAGNEVYDRVKDIITIFGKTQKKSSSETNIWKKRSIFFYLLYCSDLHMHHCLDIMHVKKNVCHSWITTLLIIKGKIKDGLKSCQDLVDIGIQEKLHSISHGRRIYLPPTCHTMSTIEKRNFCQRMWILKVPQG